MERKSETALEALKKEITAASCGMERLEAAEFFGELADWAYANGEAMLIEDDPEMQDFED